MHQENLSSENVTNIYDRVPQRSLLSIVQSLWRSDGKLFLFTKRYSNLENRLGAFTQTIEVANVIPIFTN